MWVCIDMCDYIIYICTYFYIYIFKKKFFKYIFKYSCICAGVCIYIKVFTI